MNDRKVIKRFPSGMVTLPPSKSLSHRAVICASLAALNGTGESILHHVGDSEDIRATVACMQRLGACFSGTKDILVVSRGSGELQADTPAVPNDTADQTAPGNSFSVSDGFQENRLAMSGVSVGNGALDCGESGSTLRFLLPVAAVLSEQECIFTGRGRLMERPLDVYEAVFAQSGVSFQRSGNQVSIRGHLKSGVYRLAGNISSQFISGLLLALPLAEGDSELHLTTPMESGAYVTMTIAVMKQFGVCVNQEHDRLFTVRGGQQYIPAQYTIEGDYSQAAFFLAAGALGRPVTCHGLPEKSLQGDAEVRTILTKMGVALEETEGALTALAGSMQAVTIDAREIPDLVPPLAVLCCFASGTSRIVNAGRLRIKESDRLDALATELKKLGAKIEQTADSLIITGQEWLDGGQADAHGDHRIAMAAAVAAIRCRNPVHLTGWRNVSKSYPAFWEDFEQEERHDG